MPAEPELCKVLWIVFCSVFMVLMEVLRAEEEALPLLRPTESMSLTIMFFLSTGSNCAKK